MLNIFPNRRYLPPEINENQLGSALVLKRLKAREGFDVSSYFMSSTPQNIYKGRKDSLSHQNSKNQFKTFSTTKSYTSAKST